MLRRLCSVTGILLAVAFRAPDAHSQEDRLTAGVAVGPELVGLRGASGIGAANTRVDDVIAFPGGGSLVGGRDQSTALLTAGLGLELATPGFFTFVELAYHHRMTGEHGVTAAPLLVGLRFR